MYCPNCNKIVKPIAKMWCYICPDCGEIIIRKRKV